MRKKITLTLNLEDTITVSEDDEINYVKDEMLYLMYDHVKNMSFGDFCNECNIEIEDLKDDK